jgi:1-acyl-sn-glycerol-3-phosphate acyltransferase
MPDGFIPGAHAVWRGLASTPHRLAPFGYWWDLEVTGIEVPDGPHVVAANHFSVLDPVILGKAVGPVRYLAAADIFGVSGILDRVMTSFGTIGMSRVRNPVQAMRTALRTLDEGMSVAMFPEGRRVWTWKELPPKRGAAWLAVKAGVPVLPVAIVGTEESLGRGGGRKIGKWPVRVEICEPISPDDYPDDVPGTMAMMQVWEREMGEALRRLRAGHPSSGTN